MLALLFVYHCCRSLSTMTLDMYMHARATIYLIISTELSMTWFRKERGGRVVTYGGWVRPTSKMKASFTIDHALLVQSFSATESLRKTCKGRYG